MKAGLQRREFLATLAATAVTAGGSARAAAGDDSLLMLTAGQAASIRKGSRIAERAGKLRSLADGALTKGPWSVTFHRPNTRYDAHDYFSEGPYFWPDPKNPDGPYIRHDGKRNPNRFNHNHDDLGAMATAVLTLGVGAWLFDNDGYAKQAAKNLSTWFINPQTRMNPNLEHGQAIRGVNEGRGTGLIDTVSLIHCSQGILLLEKSGKLDPALAAGLRQWFSQFLTWMTTSDKGKHEGKSGNNHATWWTSQVAAYATLSRNPDALNMAWERYRTYLVPEEIKPDGSCPREEARTNSLSYSVFNANAFATLCRIAQSSGVDLWSFKSSSGSSYEKLVRYIEPFVRHPDKWKGEQISPFKSDSVFIGLAGVGLHARDLIDAYKSVPQPDSAWVDFVDMIVSGEA